MSVERQFIEAISDSTKLDELKELVRVYGNSYINRPLRKPDYTTALILAIENHCLDTISYLLDEGVDVNMTDVADNSPLHTAVSEYEISLPACRLLIEKGKNLDFSYEVDGETAYDWAARDEDAVEVRDLIRAAIDTPIPILQRLPSSTIENQLQTPLCWKHSAVKIICRLIFLVIREDVEDQICNHYYGLIEDGHSIHEIITYAAKEGICKGNGFYKLVLTTFLHQILNHFDCTKGRSPSKVYSWIVENILTPPNKAIHDYYSDPRNPPELKELFATYATPILSKFFAANDRYKRIDDTFTYKFVKLNIEEDYKKYLDSGFYIQISVNLGSNEFHRKFCEYNRDDHRNYLIKPIPISVLNKTSYSENVVKTHSGHAMTIVGYYTLTFSGNSEVKTVYKIKNSWGENWGDGGMIEYTFTELNPILKLGATIIVKSDTKKAVDFLKVKNIPVHVNSSSSQSSMIRIDEENDDRLFQEIKTIIQSKINRCSRTLLSWFKEHPTFNSKYYDTTGKNGLIYVLETKFDDIVDQRLMVGICFNKSYEFCDFGYHIIEIAINNQVDKSIFTMIVSKTLTNKRLTSSNKYPYVIFLAIAQSNKDYCLLLLDRAKGSANVNVVNDKVETPLHVAVAVVNIDFSQVIQGLVDYGADVNAKDIQGFTPLHSLIFKTNRRDSFSCAQLLLVNGANINAINNDGQTPLDMAIMFGHPIRAFLEENGAKARSTLLYGGSRSSRCSRRHRRKKIRRCSRKKITR